MKNILPLKPENINNLTESLRQITRNRWMQRAGYSVLWLTFGLIGYIIFKHYNQVASTLRYINSRWLLYAILFNFLCFWFVAFNWYLIINAYGHRLSLYQVLRVYFLTGVGRYIPGGIWHFGGRLAWLSNLSVPLKGASESVLTEQLAVLWVGFWIGLLLSSLNFVYSVGHKILLGILCCLFLIIITTLILTWRYTKSASQHKIPFTALIQVVLYIIFWLIYGMSVYFLIVAIGPPFQIEQSMEVIGYTTLSWVIGYLIVIIPGGLGLREGILTLLLGRIVPLPLAGTIALLSRIISMASEMLWALIFYKKGAKTR